MVFTAMTLLATWITMPVPGRAQESGKKDQEKDKEVIIPGRQESEESPVGPYKQPDWTTKRRFPSTRVYVQQQPGEAEFEQWVELRIPKDRDKKHTKTRFREEFEVGLPYRFQLDLYLNTEHESNGDASKFDFRGWSAELRWAFGDWNQIFGNPTLYFEYIFMNGEPDKIEPKVLLGGNIAPLWHWGVNLVYEGQLINSDERDEEFKATGAVSYSVIGATLSLGAELEVTREVEREGGIGEWTTEILLGPSAQWRPLPKMHLDLAPLFGLTEDSKALKMFIVFGWEF